MTAVTSQPSELRKGFCSGCFSLISSFVPERYVVLEETASAVPISDGSDHSASLVSGFSINGYLHGSLTFGRLL